MSDNVADQLQNYHRTKQNHFYWKGAVAALQELFTELNNWFRKLVSRCNDPIQYHLFPVDNINEELLVKLFEEDKTSVSTYEKFDDRVNENEEEDESCEGEVEYSEEDHDDDQEYEEDSTQLKNLNQMSMLENTLVDEPESEAWKMITENFLSSSKVTVDQLGEFTNAIFLGNYQRMIEPVTEFGTVKIQPLHGEHILKSLDLNGSTNGCIMNDIFDDISTILNVQDQSIYFGIETLMSLIDKKENYIEITNTTRKIFFPVLFKHHYTLRVINLTEGVIYYYDSMIGDKTEDPLYLQIMEVLQRSAKKCGIQINSQFQSIIALCPQQNNTYDCGIYAILNMFHPRSGENNGNLKYSYKNCYREMIRECLIKYKNVGRIATELMAAEENEKQE